MMRLPGVIGICYLSALAVAFYCLDDKFLLPAAIIFALASAIGFAILMFFKRIYKHISFRFPIICITAGFACLSLVTYSALTVEPLHNRYSGKRVDFSGYICDEPVSLDCGFSYEAEVCSVNGTDEAFRVIIYSDKRLDAKPFDTVEADAVFQPVQSNYLPGRGVRFVVFNSELYNICASGHRNFSFEEAAVFVRSAAKSNLDSILSADSSALSKAVLLGDKNAIDKSLRNDFTESGLSYLIVVSGIHLSIITGMTMMLLGRLLGRRRILTGVLIDFVILFFMMIAGMYPSVLRAGIMSIIAVSGNMLFRHSEPLNSLGLAALIIALPNPYCICDVGLLLSFSSTLGIILWSKTILHFFLRRLTARNRIIRFSVRCVAGGVAVSFSAVIWTIPVTTLAFGTIHPYVVFTSLFANLLISGVLVLSALISVLFFIPPVTCAAAWIIERLTDTVNLFVPWCAELPFSSLRSDKLYFYLWIAFSAALVAVGYIIAAKKFYVITAAIASAAFLLAGASTYIIVQYNNPCIRLYSCGNAITATVTCGFNTSVLSCGGDTANEQRIIREIGREALSLDYVIIPDEKYKHSRYAEAITGEFDTANILIYDNSITATADFDGSTVKQLYDNSKLTIELNSIADDTITVADGGMFQYLRCNGITVLIITGKASVSLLEESLRTADYVVVDGIPKDGELLSCKQLIFSGDKGIFEQRYNSLTEICPNVASTADGDLELILKPD